MNAEAASARTEQAMHREQRLSSRSLMLARAGWVALAALAVAIFSTSLVARFIQVRDPQLHPSTDVMRTELGLSPDVYAGFLTALSGAFGAGCLVVAVIILRGRPAEPMALFISIFLVLLGTVNAPNMQAMESVYPGLSPLVNVAMVGTWTALLFFFLLFPDGRFVPRWTRHISFVWIASLVVAVVITGDSLTHPSSTATSLLILGSLATGAGAQIYRFVNVSSPTQRLQTKWVLLGVVAAMSIQIATALLEPLMSGPTQYSYEVFQTTAVTLAFLCVPVAIGIAVLRYRLWDIDIIINRALVYGVLSASVVSIYALIVGGAGTLLQARGSFGVSVLATGVVALLFQPLRERIQRGANRLMYGDREDPYAVLSRLGQRLESSIAPESVLPSVVETVREALRLPYAAISMNRGGASTVVATSGVPVEGPLRLPLAYQGEEIGSLLLGHRPGEATFSETDLRLLEDLARQAGIAAHGVRLTADLQRSRERIITAREEERRRLRRDLHDGLGPQLASQTLTIDATVKLLHDDPEGAAELLRDLKAQSQAAVADIRRLVYGLRPPALDDLGLAGALQALADTYRHTPLEIIVQTPQSLPVLPAAVEVACYRIIQEALTNAVRHADARQCTVSLSIVDARSTSTSTTTGADSRRRYAPV